MEKVSHRVEEIEFKEVGEIAGGIEFPTLLHRNIYNAISLNPKIKLT